MIKSFKKSFIKIVEKRITDVIQIPITGCILIKSTEKKQKIEAELRACSTLLELHVVNAHHFGFYLNEDRIIEAGYDPATFVNATVDL